jgi:hypothetical protein
MTRARVLTFHVDGDELSGVAEALDSITERFAHHPGFRGLLCLEHDSARSEIVIITLWDGGGLEDTQEVSDLGREQIAATTDLGVSSRCYDVLRLVPGPATIETVMAEALRSG